MPRRAFLGARLGPDAQAFSASGMRVEAVVPGTMAAAAGIIAGDQIELIAGATVRSLCELGHALRVAGREAAVELGFVRDGRRLSGTVPVQPFPIEDIAGQLVEYGHVEAGGAQLRTISTRPVDGAVRGSVLIIQGIACDTVDFGPGADTPLAQLVHGWARAGFATMRTDKLGIGDSGGGPCGRVDFETELDGHRAALGVLIADVRTPRPLYLFGHSIGGMIAAILANQTPVDGIIVYGTSTMKWLDCIVATTRRQLEMRGADAIEIAKRLSTLREQARTEGLNGRSAEFHSQLHEIDLDAAWARARTPRVLVARGEHDWVVSPGEQERVAHITSHRTGAAATVIDLPGLDHVLGWHPSRDLSMSDYGAGSYDPALLQRTLDWMVCCEP